MIVVDTSALLAVLLEGSQAPACVACLTSSVDIAIAAGTLAEALIVADRRGVRAELERLVDGLGVEVVATTAATAQRVADAYARWGNGVHRAGLNFGDCFAYSLADERGCPLLFVGDDFARTDVAPAIGG